jgi:hypothetical protein
MEWKEYEDGWLCGDLLHASAYFWYADDHWYGFVTGAHNIAYADLHDLHAFEEVRDFMTTFAALHGVM